MRNNNQVGITTFRNTRDCLDIFNYYYINISKINAGFQHMNLNRCEDFNDKSTEYKRQWPNIGNKLVNK